MLKTILDSEERTKLFSDHPGDLILKHMGLLSQKLELPTNAISTLLERFIAAKREPLSIITLTADAAFLSIGDKDGIRLKQLRADIAAGVEQKVFCKEYFEDILTVG